MKTIYLIRHGQTAWNREEVFRGRSDVPLDEKGRRQAELVGRYLAGQDLHEPAFFASPLTRAMETAQIAAGRFSPAHVKSDEAFNDLDFGDWQGMPREDVAAKYPELYRRWAKEPDRVRFPGGDNLNALAKRAEAGLYNLAENSSAGDLVIVTHRVVNKVLLCLVLGTNLKPFWKIKQDTACVNVLEYGKGEFIIGKVNETCHLASLEEGPKADF